MLTALAYASLHNHPAAATAAELAHAAHRFRPAEDFFDSLPHALTDRIGCVPRRPPVERAAVLPLRDMRRRLQVRKVFTKSRVS